MSNDEKAQPRKPDFYACPERDANRDYFNRLGAAWVRDDGNIYVDMENQPRTGKFVLRKPIERLQEMKDNAREERGEERREDRREAPREQARDERGSGREAGRARDTGPRYER